MKSLKSRSTFDLTLLIMGWMFIGAKGIALAQFVLGGIVFEFWAFRWIASLILIWGLFMTGVGLLKWGGGRQAAEFLMLLFGWLYWIASLVFYSSMSYEQIRNSLPLESFTGLFLLFVVCAGTGLWCMLSVSVKTLRWVAYGYGFASLVIVLLIIQKYLFHNTEEGASVFLAETLLLSIGALMFVGLLRFSRRMNEP